MLERSEIKQHEKEVTHAQTAPVRQILFDATLSSRSLGLRRVYVINNVLTLFSGNSFFGQRGMEGYRADECIDQFKYGRRDDKRHDSWHESAADFEVDHSHIIKAKRDLVTPEEFDCILNGISQYQKGFQWSLRTQNRTRYEDDNECVIFDNPILLTEKDRAKLLKKYTKFYYKQYPEKNLKK